MALEQQVNKENWLEGHEYNGEAEGEENDAKPKIKMRQQKEAISKLFGKDYDTVEKRMKLARQLKNFI